jgi:hypothetical protein
MNRHILLSVLVLVGMAPVLPARTIILTETDCEKIAMICKEAPRHSWAGYEASTGTFNAVYLELVPNRSFLIRYPIDRVPKGQRITNAELIVNATYKGAGESRVSIRRILAEWGPGVCHLYRMTRPKKVEWAVEGAQGASSDRAAKPSAVVRVNDVGDYAVNITEDVELWYTGAAANHGWIMTIDDEGGYLRMPSPAWTTRGNWRLRITYEPE